MKFRGGLVVLLMAVLLVPAGTAEARKKCPANTSGDISVNAVAKKVRGLKPTGVASPVSCAFRTISDAIASANTRAFPTSTITLRGATATRQVTLAKERFPLTIPSGVALTSDDPDLHPGRYVVEFGGTSEYAFYLDNSSIVGFSVVNRHTTHASRMVICAGGADVGHMVLDGAPTDGGTIDTGLDGFPGCSIEGSDNLIEDFAGDGILVRPGSGMALGSTEVTSNGDDGVLVQNGGSFTFSASRSHHNLGNGIEIASSSFSMDGSDVYRNGRTGPGASPQVAPEILVDGATVTFGDTSAACNNGLANRIYGYNITDTSNVNSVGLRAINNSTVNANNNYWASTDLTQNVSQQVGSTVTANLICGTLSDPG